jgi:PBSX family phage terminase large subunit
MADIVLSDLIIPKFFEIHNLIHNSDNEIYDFWLKGGRGSTKSSFISLEIPLILAKNPSTHFVVLRKVGDTLHTSVYNQMLWAFDKLRLTPYIKATKSPLEITYYGNGMEQVIYFRGCDDALKLKSIIPKKGRIIGIWFEELAEFGGINEIRNVLQSIMRGEEIEDIRKSGTFYQFASYNPPERITNWVNAECNNPVKSRFVSSSSYLDLPKDKQLRWLGKKWLEMSEHLKKVNETAYRHEYLGEITGTGGAVFTNIKQLEMTDEMISQFDNLKQGLDFGYTNAACWVRLHYDNERKSIYIFDEIYGSSISNESMYRKIMAKSPTEHLQNVRTFADCAEPKSIEQLKGLGLHIKPCEKGGDSRDFGINWLQGLENIYIDAKRCPNVWREFSLYELEKDKNGNFKDGFPKVNDHSIDSVSYSLNDDKKRKSFW